MSRVIVIEYINADGMLDMTEKITLKHHVQMPQKAEDLKAWMLERPEIFRPTSDTHSRLVRVGSCGFFVPITVQP